MITMFHRAVAIALAAAAVAAGAPAATAAVTPGQVCGLSSRAVQESSGGTWLVTRANAFDVSGQRFCVNPAAAGPGFTVATNLHYTGLWQAYPFTGLGCAYSLCSRNTDLPKRVAALARGANVSYSWRGANAPGIWNTALDLWFDKRDQITAQDDGAELMLWLRTPPGYSGGQLVRIGHRSWWFMHWRAHHGAYSWWYIQFRAARPVMGVRQLWLRPFMRFLERQHPRLIVPGWYLTSVHAGFEMVSGGRGLQVRWFNAHV
jgi:hypothetical protein